MVKLSICIPTFNRSSCLSRLLYFFRNEVRFPFSYEIIITDNCSSDGTSEIISQFIECGLPIRYYRNNENLGVDKNSIRAHRLATGLYVMYMADDDLFIPDELVSVLGFLDNHTEVACVYAPWQIWDNVNKVEVSRTCHFEHPIIVNKSNWTGFFESMINKNIMLEIGVYRTDLLYPILLNHSFCFPPDILAVHMLQKGSIVLSNRPYYRYIFNSELERDRPNEGSVVARYGWDERSGGAEYFFHYASKISGLSLDRDQLDALAFLVEVFRIQRMLTALGIMMKSGDHVERHYLYCRVHTALTVLKPVDRIAIVPQHSQVGTDPAATKNRVQNFIARLKQELESYKPNPATVALQATCRLLVNHGGQTVFYVLCPELVALEASLRSHGLPLSISITGISLQNLPSRADIGENFVVIASNDHKSSLLAFDIPPLQLISLADIEALYQS